MRLLGEPLVSNRRIKLSGEQNNLALGQTTIEAASLSGRAES